MEAAVAGDSDANTDNRRDTLPGLQFAASATRPAPRLDSTSASPVPTWKRQPYKSMLLFV